LQRNRVVLYATALRYAKKQKAGGGVGKNYYPESKKEKLHKNNPNQEGGLCNLINKRVGFLKTPPACKKK